MNHILENGQSARQQRKKDAKMRRHISLYDLIVKRGRRLSQELVSTLYIRGLIFSVRRIS
jgi:hypothetical protein